MDISVGSVPAGLNLTGEMEPGINTNIWTEYVYEKQIYSYILKEHFFTVLLKMHFSVRIVFQSACVLNSFNMFISGMKTQF